MMREIEERVFAEASLSGSAAAGVAMTAIDTNARTLRRVMREPPNNPEDKPFVRF